jgi:hypothetical protein
MQNIKLHQHVRISSKSAARELGVPLWSRGKVTWIREDFVEVDLGTQRVMIRSKYLERVKGIHDRLDQPHSGR